MLGRDLADLLIARGEQVTGLARKDLDLTDSTAVRAAVEATKPDVVVNCAAWTKVDDAETCEDAALAINGHAVAELASTCAKARITLVQMSTDYVFDGTAASPYPEEAEATPRTAYGRTKLAGERAVFAVLPDAYVMRTAWLYGAYGPNFVRTMINMARSGRSPAVVDDQRGQPTWTVDVAGQIYALITHGAPPGIYHATSAGETTWYGLAAEVFTLFKSVGATDAPGASLGTVTPTTSAAYQRPAPRPAYSVLGHDAWKAAAILPIGHWRDALSKAFPAMIEAS